MTTSNRGVGPPVVGPVVGSVVGPASARLPEPATGPATGIAKVRRGTPGFRRLVLALSAASLGTCGTLFAPQPLLPLLSADFGVSPATASLAISATTGAMACAVLPLSSISEVVGRTRVMTVAVFGTAVLGLLIAASPSFPILVALRTLQGVALAGLAAIGMAYISEEVEEGSLGFAMGLYVASNGLGGMAGRLVSGLVADVAGWRWALAAVGLAAVACAVLFRVSAPPSAHFTPKPPRPRALIASLAGTFTDTGLCRLYALALLMMASFITVYNYLGYRLLDAPFGLSPGVVGLLYIVYIAGSAASAGAGRLADRFGRRRMLWLAVVVALAGLALMLPDNLVLIGAGLTALTMGFFAAHGVASGWVGRRAPRARAQATGMYVCAYYAGSSVGGYSGGLAYGAGGWLAMTALVGALLTAALLISLSLRTLAPR